MIKDVTRIYEVRVCDYCNAEEDPSMRWMIRECLHCGADVCENCSVEVCWKAKDDKLIKGSLCRKHIPPELFKI